MKNKLLAMLLILMLILTAGLQGCSGAGKGKADTFYSNGVRPAGEEAAGGNTKEGSGGTPAMGRYMEKAIDLPKLSEGEAVSKILENRDKQLEVYTQSADQCTCYRLNKDMTWERTVPGWLNGEAFKADDMLITDICFDKDGNYYACTNIFGVKEVKSVILKSEDGGQTARTVDLPYLKEADKVLQGYTLYPRIQELGVLENGNLVLFDLRTSDILLVFSPEGKKLDEITIGENQNFMVSKNTIITTGKEENSIIFYDTVNKKVEKTIDYEIKSMYLAYAMKEDGTLIVGDNKGIHRRLSGGTLWETTVDGALNSMSMPSLNFTSLFVTDDKQEEYYTAYIDNEGGYKLMKYTFDKDVASIPSKEITVYSLRENSTVRQAISLFQAKNDDIKVNYVVAMGDGSANISDYIRALNTELLAGKGADVLVLDGLPAASYIEKGVLEDITDLIRPLEESGALLTNITESYHTDGKIYQIPIGFSIPIVAGVEEAVNNSDSLASVVNYIEQSGATYLSINDIKSLLKDYYALYSSEMFRDGLLDEDLLTAFLENVKKVLDNADAQDLSSDGEQDEENGMDIFKSQGLISNDALSLGKINDAALFQLRNIYDTLIPFSVIKNNNMKYSPVASKFIPSGLVGLNRAGREQSIAKQFISFLFSEEVQDTNLPDGFPVNVSSLKEITGKDNANYSVSFSFKGSESIVGLWPSREERDAFLKTAMSVNKPIEIDYVLCNMIIDEAMPYLLGDTDLDQAVSTVISKVNLYLAE